MTHTPGPWKYVYDTEQVVAASGSVGRFEPASGPLAAAAPDLLAAAEKMLAAAQGTDMEAIFDAHAATLTAVKKARGES